jgi:hypothetical protein
MTATNGAVLADQVRQLIASARQAGDPDPGRPSLVKATGATDYQIRKVLAELEADLATAGGDAGDSTASVTADMAPAAPVETSVTEELATVGEPLSPAVASPTEAPETVQGTAPGGGKFVAWMGFAFGSIVSVAANVLAARIVPEHAPADWQPSIFAQVGAAVWPLALLISVEVLSRVQWRRGALWGFARYGGAGTVALGSAVISYGHIRDVLGSWGYSPLGAGVGPLVVDGLMVVSGFALLAMAGDRGGE